MIIIIIICTIILITITYIFIKRRFFNKTIQSLKVENFQKKLNNITQELKKDSNKEDIKENVKEDLNKKFYNLNELLKLYKNGIPDTYDVNGNIIDGIPPEPIKAIETILLIIDITQDDERMNYILDLAKIYHQGIHTYKRNLEEAQKVYEYILNNSNNEKYIMEANEGIKDINKIHSYTWLNLPLDHDPMKIMEKSKKEDLNLNKRPVNIQFHNTIDPEHLRIFEEDDFGHDIEYTEENIRLAEELQNQILINRNRGNQLDFNNFVNNDMQNTHDTGVLGTIKASINKLKENVHINNNSLNEIRDYIRSKNDNRLKGNALRALEEIRNNNERVSSVDSNEMDVLNLVWSRINSDELKENQEDLKKTFMSQLGEMIEHNNPVCSTGRVTRLVDTLNVVDPLINIKSTTDIRQEMLLKASKIRNELENKDKNVDDVVVKDTIITQLKKDYLDTNILSEDRFNSETKMFDYI